MTGAVTAELLRYCDQVVLNVRADNPPAINAYRRLGYLEHTRFEELAAGHALGALEPDVEVDTMLALREAFGRECVRCAA